LTVHFAWQSLSHFSRLPRAGSRGLSRHGLVCWYSFQVCTIDHFSRFNCDRIIKTVAPHREKHLIAQPTALATIFTCVQCKNFEQVCHSSGFYFPIHISCSNLSETESGLPRLSKESFPLRIVCPQCVHWFAYSEGEIESCQTRISSQTEEPDVDYLAVEIRCAVEGCESITTYYAVEKISPCAQRLVFCAVPQITCLNGHLLKEEDLLFRVSNLK
jgi:hypothetical protein